MLRRLYFAVPDARSARRIVNVLAATGVVVAQVHATARPGVDLAALPAATGPQRRDRVWRLEQLFWKSDLGIFALAAGGLILAAFTGSIPGVALALAVMLLSFVIGNRFAVRLPHAHLGELRIPLQHGEVVLMVDVPKHRVSEIEQLVSRHHPEAQVGGVGWTIPGLGT